jgi:hypothetical protein
VVSSALKEMLAIREARYPVGEWNVYCAQASDGDNSGSDSRECVALLTQTILPLVQYYAYIEIADEGSPLDGGGKELWRAYAGLKETTPGFAMARVAGRSDIYPVFRKLFAKQPSKGAVS